MPEVKRPLILISNDDGMEFAGIQCLIKVARKHGDVVVVAPLLHQSGMSSAITILTPLRAFKVKEEPGLTVYRVAGTPVDCVKLAYNNLLNGRQPDLALSGINHGYNMGVSTLYSGTMGVAFEALAHHTPTVAFSIGIYTIDADFSHCLPLIDDIIGRVLAHGLPRGVCLNVNFPPGEIKGVKVTTTAMGKWTNEYEHRVDPHGMDYYWMQGNYVPDNPDDNTTDIYCTQRGYASVTPCHIDQTDHAAMPQIEDLLG